MPEPSPTTPFLSRPRRCLPNCCALVRAVARPHMLLPCVTPSGIPPIPIGSTVIEHPCPDPNGVRALPETVDRRGPSRAHTGQRGPAVGV